MSFKKKARKKFKFAATTFLLIFGGQSIANAQQSAQAEMSITVRVVEGPRFTDAMITDISDQITSSNPEFNLGAMNIKVPEGTGYSISFDPEVKMKSETSDWVIKTSIDQQISQNGEIKLALTGGSTVVATTPSNYIGHHTSRVEYH